MSRFPEVSRAGVAVPASIFIRLREHLGIASPNNPDGAAVLEGM